MKSNTNNLLRTTVLIRPFLEAERYEISIDSHHHVYGGKENRKALCLKCSLPVTAFS